jgi:hypothetical protein
VSGQQLWNELLVHRRRLINTPPPALEIKETLSTWKPDEVIQQLISDMSKVRWELRLPLLLSLGSSLSGTYMQVEAVARRKAEEISQRVEDHVRVDMDSVSKAWEQLEEAKSRVQEVGRQQESMIKLNIGGTFYTTSRHTLCKEDSMLSAMFSGRHSMIKDEAGAHFIDRSPKHFDRILNYLRCVRGFTRPAKAISLSVSECRSVTAVLCDPTQRRRVHPAHESGGAGGAAAGGVLLPAGASHSIHPRSVRALAEA